MVVLFHPSSAVRDDRAHNVARAIPGSGSSHLDRAFQRALLAESLWESIDDPFELTANRSDEDAVALAIKRDLEVESGKVEPISHDQLMRELRR